MAGHSPWGHKESDRSELLSLTQSWLGAFQVVLVVKNLSACRCKSRRRSSFDPWVGKIPWRRAWQPLQYFCLEIPWTREPGGYSPWGHKELDMTEATQPIHRAGQQRGASPARLAELCCPPDFLFLIINECSSTDFFLLLSQPSLGSSKQKGALYNAGQSSEETQSLFGTVTHRPQFSLGRVHFVVRVRKQLKASFLHLSLCYSNDLPFLTRDKKNPTQANLRIKIQVDFIGYYNKTKQNKKTRRVLASGMARSRHSMSSDLFLILFSSFFCSTWCGPGN